MSFTDPSVLSQRRCGSDSPVIRDFPLGARGKVFKSVQQPEEQTLPNWLVQEQMLILIFLV